MFCRSGRMSAVRGSLANVKHTEILHKFRKNIEAFYNKTYSDECLLRWLNARNFDLRRAQRLFRANENLREVYRLDSIVKTYQKPKVIRDCEFASFIGFDKEGSPIQYVAIGHADLNGFLHSMSTFDIILYCSYSMEKLCDLQKEYNKINGRKGEMNITVIMDFDNFSLQQITQRPIIEVGFDLLRLLQDTQPEILNHVIMINVPVYFAAIFNIFKPILRMEILEKIVVSSKEASANELLKFIDADVLPAFLGGNKVDENGDPNCSSFIKFPSQVPEELYGKNQPPLIQITDPNVSEINIPARTTKDVIVEVNEPGSEIQIELQGDNTIGLRVLYRKTNASIISGNYYPEDFTTEEEQVSPYAKIQTHLAASNNTLYCSRAGTYVFRFDNTFSWVSSKYIIYRIRVHPPLNSLK